MTDMVDRVLEHFSERDVAIFLAYVGARDGVRLSMRKAGAPYGLSAERVRQIVNAIKEGARVLLFPERERFGELLAARAPCAASALDSDVESIIGSPAFGTAGLLQFFSHIGLELAYRCVTFKGIDAQVVVARECAERFEQCWTIFRAMAQHSGAADASALVTQFNREFLASGRTLEVAEAEEFLVALKRLGLPSHVDDRARQWVSLPASDVVPFVKLASILQRTRELALTDRVERKVLFGAHRHCVPVPRPVLTRFLATAGIECRHNIARLSSRAAVAEGLPEGVGGRALDRKLLLMLDLLVKKNRRMDKRAYLDACEQAGVAFITARIYMYNSGIFRISGGQVSIGGS